MFMCSTFVSLVINLIYWNPLQLYYIGGKFKIFGDFVYFWTFVQSHKNKSFYFIFYKNDKKRRLCLLHNKLFYRGNWQLVPFHSRHQGILNGEVSLYHWPPVWLVWNQLYDNWQFLFLFAKQTNSNQSNRRSTFSIPWWCALCLARIY